MADKTIEYTSTGSGSKSYSAYASDSCGNKDYGTWYWGGDDANKGQTYVLNTAGLTFSQSNGKFTLTGPTKGNAPNFSLVWKSPKVNNGGTTYTVAVVFNIKNPSKVSMVQIQNNFPGSWYWVNEKGTSHSIFAGSTGNTTGVATVTSDATITLNIVLSATNANAPTGGPYSKCNSCYAAITISGSNLQVSNPSGNWTIAGDLTGATSVEFTTATNLPWDSLVGNLSGSVSVDNGDYTLTVKWQLVNS